MDEQSRAEPVWTYGFENIPKEIGRKKERKSVIMLYDPLRICPNGPARIIFVESW
jgi:hypothetical protein